MRISQIAEIHISILRLRENIASGPMGFQRGYKLIIPYREQWTEQEMSFHELWKTVPTEQTCKVLASPLLLELLLY